MLKEERDELKKRLSMKDHEIAQHIDRHAVLHVPREALGRQKRWGKWSGVVMLFMVR